MTAPLQQADPMTVGGYTLLGRLGSGGMGTVYLAKGAAGEEVAIKVLHARLSASPQFLARFADEAAAAARVAGFCTAKVLHADVHARPPYLVTEYVAGPTLDAVLAGGKPLPASEVEALAVGVAAALTAIHAAGLAHRDLKPSNVLLSRVGPKVIDFGIARALDMTGDRTETGMLFGTLGWLAPEQLYGQSTQASDVFVWGLLITRAGTGWRPAAELQVSVPSDAEIGKLPRSLAAAVTTALSLEPAARPSARDLLLRLCGSTEAGPVRTATKVLSRPWATPYPTTLGYPTGAAGPAAAYPAAPPYQGAPSHQAAVLHPTATRPATQSRPADHLPAVRSRDGSVAAPHQPRPGYPVRHGAPVWRRRRWYTRKRYLLLAVLVLVLVLINKDRGNGKTEQLPPSTVRDGILEFTLLGWRCGLSSLGTPPLARQAQGQLCTFELRVHNFGDGSRRVYVSSQKLRDAAGRTIEPDGIAWGYLEQARPFLHEINPGNEVTGVLVYDIAKDSQPQQLEVHDSPLSGGATITLS
jgi:hypothetical protein